MSLIRCSECNKEISEKAKTCPNCGNPIELSDEIKKQAVKKNEEQQVKVGIIAIVAIISILLLVYICSSWLWNGLGVNNFLKSQGIDMSNNTITITDKNNDEYKQWKDETMNWLGFEKQ